jgi:hypothetical protein
MLRSVMLTILAHAGVRWFGLTILYLALQLAWDWAAVWAGTWQGRAGNWLAAVRDWPYAHWLGLAGKLFYYLGLPYGALLLGVADAQRLGLAGLTWWPQAPLALLVGLAGVVLLGWTWGQSAAVAHRRAGHYRLLGAEAQALRAPWGWVPLLLQVLCLEGNWAFVRGAAVALVGVYGGIWLGLGLVAVIWLLRPMRAEALADPVLRARTLLTLGLATMSGIVFMYAENLWICLLVHALGFVVAALAAGRAYRVA